MKTNKSKSSQINIQSVALVVVLIFLIICHGGYSFSVIVLSGAVMSVLLAFATKGVSISLSQGIFTVFSLWYFICSLRHGFITEYAAKGALPTVLLIFWLFISSGNINKPKIINALMEASMWIALFSIIHCIVISINASSVQRLVFPFDYSNACGIYFAVCYFLCSGSESSFVRRIRFVFPVALILTQSVGAGVLFFAALIFTFIKQKKYIAIACIFIALVLFILVFSGRIAQSMGTFAERILHINDGLRCLADNPLSGIGAGWWEHAGQSYRTGYYSARVIHSSITSIAVNSGIPGIVLFLAVLLPELIAIFKAKKYFLPALILIIHSMADFSLSFTVLGVMLVLMTSESKKKIPLNPIAVKTSLIALSLGFVLVLSSLLTSGIYQKKLETTGGNTQHITAFKTKFALRHSVRSAQCLAAKLYSDADLSGGNIFENYKFMPTEVILYNAMLKQDENYILDIFSRQSYNTALRDYIIKDFPAISEKVEKITADAVEKASPVGKYLYKLKGENK